MKLVLVLVLVSVAASALAFTGNAELDTVECEFEICYDIMELEAMCNRYEIGDVHRSVHEGLADDMEIPETLVDEQIKNPATLITSPEMWRAAEEAGIAAPMMRCSFVNSETLEEEFDTEHCRWETADEKVDRMNMYIVRCNRGVNVISGDRHNPWLSGKNGGVMPAECGFNCWMREPDPVKYRENSGCGRFYVSDKEFRAYKALVGRHPLKNCRDMPGESPICDNMEEMHAACEKVRIPHPDIECPGKTVDSCQWQAPDTMRSVRFQMELRCLAGEDPYRFELIPNEVATATTATM